MAPRRERVRHAVAQSLQRCRQGGSEVADGRRRASQWHGGVVDLEEAGRCEPPHDEAEFVAASEVARELIGLRQMLGEVDMALVVRMLMHVDNQAAISQIEGEASSIKAKHIDVRYKYLRDIARSGVVMAQHGRSELMLADLMTKAVDATKMATLRSLMRLV